MNEKLGIYMSLKQGMEWEKGKSVCEDFSDSDLDDFIDNDYSMREDSVSHDDNLYENNVVEDQLNDVIDDTGSSDGNSDEDVAYAEGDFDESKDSDT